MVLLVSLEGKSRKTAVPEVTASIRLSELGFLDGPCSVNNTPKGDHLYFWVLWTKVVRNGFCPSTALHVGFGSTNFLKSLFMRNQQWGGVSAPSSGKLPCYELIVSFRAALDVVQPLFVGACTPAGCRVRGIQRCAKNCPQLT